MHPATKQLLPLRLSAFQHRRRRGQSDIRFLKGQVVKVAQQNEILIKRGWKQFILGMNTESM